MPAMPPRSARFPGSRATAEVVTVTVDVGQGESLLAVRERALEAGAVRAHVLDAREAFAHDVRAAGAARRGRSASTATRMRPCWRCPASPRRWRRWRRWSRPTRWRMAGRARRRRGWRACSQATSRIPVRPSVEATMPAEARAAAMAALQIDADAMPAVRATLWGRSLPVAGRARRGRWTRRGFTQTRAVTRGPDAPAMLDIGFDGGHSAAGQRRGDAARGAAQQPRHDRRRARRRPRRRAGARRCRRPARSGRGAGGHGAAARDPRARGAEPALVAAHAASPPRREVRRSAADRRLARPDARVDRRAGRPRAEGRVGDDAPAALQGRRQVVGAHRLPERPPGPPA